MHGPSAGTHHQSPDNRICRLLPHFLTDLAQCLVIDRSALDACQPLNLAPRVGFPSRRFRRRTILFPALETAFPCDQVHDSRGQMRSSSIALAFGRRHWVFQIVSPGCDEPLARMELTLLAADATQIARVHNHGFCCHPPSGGGCNQVEELS